MIDTIKFITTLISVIGAIVGGWGTIQQFLKLIGYGGAA